MKVTPRLLEKATKVFEERKHIFAGEGLTRAELRALKKYGFVKKTLVRTETGALRNLWYRESPLEGLRKYE